MIEVHNKEDVAALSEAIEQLKQFVEFLTDKVADIEANMEKEITNLHRRTEQWFPQPNTED